jgi:hypothetical protein
MSNFPKRALFCMPCALFIVFIAFPGVFALDVFDRHPRPVHQQIVFRIAEGPYETAINS